jgi:hypothetical protein
MSTPGDTGGVVELAPLDAVPSGKSPGGYHRRWWDEPGILDELPWLRHVKRVKKYVRLVVDDHGNIVPEAK